MRASHLAWPIIAFPLSAMAVDDINMCNELLKLRENKFLCLSNAPSGAGALEHVSLYENGKILPIPDALYRTTSGKDFLVEKENPMPLSSTSYLRDGRQIIFFDAVDHQQTFFCEYPTAVTAKRDTGQDYVTHYQEGSCTLVPDGRYQTKSDLAYTIFKGEATTDNNTYMTCFHTWRDGHEAMDCEDRN